MTTAKGTTIVYVPEFIKKKFGEEAYNKWLDALKPEVRLVYSKTALPVNLYPLREYYIEPTIKLCEMFYHGDWRGARELGMYSADYALHGIYKFFVKFGSPEFIIKKAGTIMPTYYQPSEMKTIEVGKGSGIVRITQFEDMHEVVEERIKGWIIRALEICGVKNISVAITKSLLRNDPYTEFMIRWGE